MKSIMNGKRIHLWLEPQIVPETMFINMQLHYGNIMQPLLCIMDIMMTLGDILW